MLNQAVLESMYSVPYAECYLDIVENLPGEIQRFLTMIRELDVTYQAQIKELDQLSNVYNNVTDSTAKKKNLLKAQVALIAAQEIGDEKLSIMQQIQDIIEGRTRHIDSFFYNLPSAKVETVKKEVENSDSNTNKSEEATPQRSTSTNNTDSPNPPKKRARRKQVESSEDVLESSSTPLPRSTATIAVPKKSAVAKDPVKKKKRRSRQQQETSVHEDMNIDPDEPTYCLCNQVSYGQMVMCDNDLCPHQWFHFSCVSVTNTPKGKWYCPNCRKARSNAVRPKKQLVERLEKYNKEKQEKNQEKYSKDKQEKNSSSKKEKDSSKE